MKRQGRGLARRLLRSCALILYALLPPKGGEPRPERKEAERCTPQQFRLGVAQFLDARGEFKIFFPDTLPLAAPVLLFRVKRQGYSRCSVKAADGGLYLQGRR